MGGLLTGKANVVQFDVLGELPHGDVLGFVGERIRTFSFKDIDDAYDEFSVGWVSILDMFDSQFTDGSELSGEYMTVSLRIDERKIPGKLLKKFVAKEIRRVMAEQQVPRLSRHARVQSKERIRTEMLRKAKPESSLFEICWDISGRELLFFSTDKKAMAILEDFFKETFGLMLRQRVPFIIAESLLQEYEIPALNNITECAFV